MAIPYFEEDVEVISKLGDVPGSDNGLSSAGLKGAFDRSAVLIKRFLNEQLIPHLNQLVDVQSLLDGVLDSTLSLDDKAANAKITGEKIAEALRIANGALPKSGGYMSGGINMSNQQLTGLPAPRNNRDAATKEYVDGRKVKAEITLPHGGWQNFEQTITHGAVKEDSIIFSGYADESVDAGRMADVRCVRKAEGQLTFSCRWVPAEDVKMNVTIWN